jgi:hypothetical protein
VKSLERYKSFDEMKSKESAGTMSSPEKKKLPNFSVCSGNLPSLKFLVIKQASDGE